MAIAHIWSTRANGMGILAVIVSVVGMQDAIADELRISKVEPAHVMREAATLEVAILGGGFNAATAVRFLLTGTSDPGGITVRRVKLVDPRKLVATVEIDSKVAPGYFDVQIGGEQRDEVRGRSLLLVEPYSWSARFGCSGAETWRLRIPCKRGKVD